MKCGGWGRLITLPTWLMVPRRGHGPPSRSTGDAYELQMGYPPGENMPSRDQSDLGTKPFHYTPNSPLETPVGRLFSPRVGREAHLRSRTSTGVGLCRTPVLGLSKLAALALPGAEMFTLSIYNTLQRARISLFCGAS